MPFKTLLTTSPFTFLEDALRRAGKDPRTEVCRWTNDADRHHPYDHRRHAIGPTTTSRSSTICWAWTATWTRWCSPRTTSWTTWATSARARDYQSADYVPALVRKTFSNDLIVLGFSLDSWAFRVIYAGLIKRSGKAKDRGRL